MKKIYETDFDNTQIVHFENNYRKRTIREMIRNNLNKRIKKTRTENAVEASMVYSNLLNSYITVQKKLN